MPISRRNMLALLASAPVLASCGVGGSSPGEGKSVRVAFQNFADSTLLVKDKQALEKALPAHKITWTAFDSGASINTAFLGGAIDLAVIGSSPAAAGLCPLPSGYGTPARGTASGCPRTPGSRSM